MIYAEEDLLPLSALQHILFCERQCALIHIEQLWVENLYTAQGRVMHERVDQTGRENRRNLRIEYGMLLRSLAIGLVGKADVVEFHRQEDGKWLPFPVEYKRGKPKKEDWDKVQLCAQGLCLEEMLGVEVPEGALFYGKNRRRQQVTFDDRLRRQTVETASRVHALVASGATPAPVYLKRCEACSFVALCLPKLLEKKRRIDVYLSQALQP